MKGKAFPTVQIGREVEVGLHEGVQGFFLHALIQPVLHEAAEREGGKGHVLLIEGRGVER